MIDTEILQDYAGEAGELLDEMDHSLILLEKEGVTRELLDNIFRAVHCIKGSAEFLGLERSSTLTHGVENLLDRVREGLVDLDAPIMEFLFRSKDLIQKLIAEVAQEHEEHSTISELMAQLENILTRRQGATQVDEVVEAGPTESEKNEEFDQGEESQPTQSTLESPVGASVEFPIIDSTDSHDLAALADEIREEIEHTDVMLPAAALEPNKEHQEAPTESFETPITPDVGVMGDYGSAESFTGDQIESPGAVTTLSLAETVPLLLNISLYFDDLQDGLTPEEVRHTLDEAINQLIGSYKSLGMKQAVKAVEGLKSRFEEAASDHEVFSESEIAEYRSELYALEAFYPSSLFPLQKSVVSPSSGNNQDGVEKSPPESDELPKSHFHEEMEKIPGIDGSMILAMESAGFNSLEEISNAKFNSLAAVAGIGTVPANLIFDYLGVTPPSAPAATGQSLRRKPKSHSLLGDIDDELLSEFGESFDAAFGYDDSSQPVDRLPGNRAKDLLQELESVNEDSDREIIDIFLAYGWEILDKIRPHVEKARIKTPDKADLEQCAEHIKAIRSSSSYMDYKGLASFLDNWHEKTVWSAQNLTELSNGDFEFLNDSFLKFQDFLRGLEVILNPQLAPVINNVPGKPITQSTLPEVQAELREDTAGPPAPDAQIDPAQARPFPNYESEATFVEAPHKLSQNQSVLPMAEAGGAKKYTGDLLEDRSTAEDLAASDSREGAVVRTMRVDSSKVDILLNQVGELVVNRSYVEQLAVELKSFHRQLLGIRQLSKKELQSLKDLSLKVNEASLSLGRVATDLQEGVMKLRMLPVGQLFNRMPRLIRDLSRRVGKNVTLEVHGGDTEVDKRVIEQIYNPLVHLIRNAVDHGIEEKEIRREKGKSEEGVVTLSAYSQGNQVVIDVEDDGGGIDTTTVLDKAIQTKILDDQDQKALSAQDIYNLLFIPGFSTSRKVTRTSGRGVGMDVVKRDVEKINGHVEVESWEEKGTRISIRIPLTLAIIQTLLIRSAKHVFAIPLTSVREIIQVSPHEITTIEGFEVIKFRDETIPVLRVAEIFKLRDHQPDRQPRFLVLAGAGAKSVGFLVEELIGEQDVVIKPLAEHVCESRGLAGSTILGDGTIALVLDVMEIIDDVIAEQRQIAHAEYNQFVLDAKEGLEHSPTM